MWCRALSCHLVTLWQSARCGYPIEGIRKHWCIWYLARHALVVRFQRDDSRDSREWAHQPNWMSTKCKVPSEMWTFKNNNVYLNITEKNFFAFKLIAQHRMCDVCPNRTSQRQSETTQLGWSGSASGCSCIIKSQTSRRALREMK